MHRKFHVASIGAIVLALAGAAPSAGQVRGRPSRPPVNLPGSDLIRLACCRCVGTPDRVVRINTGSGPDTVSWRVSSPGMILPNPIAQTVVNAYSYWSATLNPARWVHPNDNNGAANLPPATYTYEITIEVPRCSIPMDVIVTGRAAADDNLTVWMDTSQIGVTPLVPAPPHATAADGGWGFRSERIVPFTATIGPGTHILRFVVVNGSFSPHGLLVRGEVLARCPMTLEQPPAPR